MRTTTIIAAAVVAGIILVSPIARSDDSSVPRRMWNVAQATAMNTIPFVSALASPRCLPGYVACKLTFAAMGVIASGAQVVAGGDFAGATRTLERAFGGDWIVTATHIATGVKPDPYPEAAAATGGDDLPPI